MDFKEVFFTGHAIQRMFERGISKEDAMSVLTDGETIAEYPEDRPFPDPDKWTPDGKLRRRP